MMWDCVHDVPLSTPGPDDLSKTTGEGKRHTAEYLDAERVVSGAINDQWKEEKVNPLWMQRLLIHVYRHGYPVESFKLYDDPTKGYIPRGLIELGYDAETLVKIRLRQFRMRLLKKADEHLKMMQEAS